MGFTLIILLSATHIFINGRLRLTKEAMTLIFSLYISQIVVYFYITYFYRTGVLHCGQEIWIIVANSSAVVMQCIGAFINIDIDEERDDFTPNIDIDEESDEESAVFNYSKNRRTARRKNAMW